DRQGAAFYMEDSANKLYGWEAPSVLTAFRRIATYDLDDCVLVATDTGLVAAGTYSTGGGKYLRLLQLSSTGAITTTTSYFDTSAYTTRTLAYCPGLVRLPSGRVVCVFVGQESTGYQSIRSIYSDDDGANWALLSPRLIPTTYNPATTLLRRIRAACSQGQILITIAYAQGITDAVAQLASYDGGATATIVAGLDGTTAGLATGGYHEVVALPSGGFLLAYLATADQYPYSYRIASAEEPFAYASTQATIVAAGSKWGTLTGSFLTDADLVMGVDEAGTAYLTGRLAGGNDQWISFRSVDRGDTWEPMGETTGLQAGAWHLPNGVAGSGPIDAGGCWYRGSLLLCHSSQSPVASAGASQQWISRLGGWRSLTMPALYSGS
ncbi:MAG TPA: sialidase family protein, partial [Myxococcota bacterium]|nr:sialidase family protein [Myxococcota bacterium]